MKNIFNNIFDNAPDGGGQEPSLDRKLKIATAALLLEVAAADDEFSADERLVIINTLQNHFEISAGEVEEILEATGRELNRSIDLYHFTNQINEYFDKDQKEQLIEMIWRVIYVDKHLDGHEDYLVHRFAKLLRLHHSRLIDAKLRVKNEKEAG